MNDDQAHKILRDMRDAMLNEVALLEMRLVHENAEYEQDPDPLTAHIIERTAAKVTLKRIQAEALAIAVTKF